MNYINKLLILSIFVLLFSQSIFASDINARYYLQNYQEIKGVDIGFSNLNGSSIDLHVSDGNINTFLTIRIENQKISDINTGNNMIESDYVYYTDIDTLQGIIDSTNKKAAFTKGINDGKILYETNSGKAWFYMNLFMMFSNWWFK